MKKRTHCYESYPSYIGCNAKLLQMAVDASWGSLRSGGEPMVWASAPGPVWGPKHQHIASPRWKRDVPVYQHRLATPRRAPAGRAPTWRLDNHHQRHHRLGPRGYDHRFVHAWEAHEVEDGLELLYCLGLRNRVGAELIACPTCGRIQVDLFTLVQAVKKKLDKEIELPIKVAVMGCVVNGPGEAEGADVAVFAGNQRGIIYVQGERVANVREEEILDRLLEECRRFQDRVRNGEVTLGEKVVEIVPPDPIGELGSGVAKIESGQVERLTIDES